MHEARGQIDCFGAFGFAPVLLDVEDAYTYSASGEKLRKVSGSTTIEYVGGIQYDNLSGTTGVDFIQTEEGRATRRTDGTFRYDYDLTDHLGNVRVSFYKDPNTGIATVLQKDDYYPFGKRYAVYAGSNHYLCNKKELQDATGDYDYGARQYDPAIGRWITLDPMAEVSRRWSPYNYAANNPINKVDVDGLYDQALFDQWEKEDREQKEEDIAKYGLHGGGGITPDAPNVEQTSDDNETEQNSGPETGKQKTDDEKKHDAEVQKSGVLEYGFSTSASGSFMGGAVIEFGWVATDKNYVQYYYTISGISGLAAPSSSGNFSVVTNNQGYKPTFSDWKGGAVNASLSYKKVAVSASRSEAYTSYSGNHGYGMKVPLFEGLDPTVTVGAGKTNLLWSPLYMPMSPKDYLNRGLKSWLNMYRDLHLERYFHLDSYRLFK
jgi:RHS repeat-associated protein